ncbi:MAG: S8 family serine peptidase, partial [Halioglobus sp.]|nr:S8 family serine peptidase [Halioglobus sp.]
MLQGESAKDIAALVREVGGEVTHDLHIIEAVGALVTGEQLAELKRSPLVTRTIDDLARLDDRERRKDDEQACRVRGHIELDLTTEGFRWQLYNKRPDPAELSSIKLSWPRELGALQELRLGTLPLPLAKAATSDHGSLTLELPEDGRPTVHQRTELHARFALPTVQDGFSAHQRDFGIELGFAAGCSDKLVPAYSNNSTDFYYNRVSGVEQLHQQGITGKGVTVAVIDSGLWEHDDLARDTAGKPRIVGRYDAVNDVAGAPAPDESGHGTHMTSIIANSANTLVNGKPNGSFRGVAPDVNLVAVK